MTSRGRRSMRSPALRARDAGRQRLQALTVAATAMGAAGTVLFGGAAALTYAGHSAPTAAPTLTGPGGSATAGTAGSVGAATVPDPTPAARHHHSSSSTPQGQGQAPAVIAAPGNPGSGLITSGGS